MKYYKSIYDCEKSIDGSIDVNCNGVTIEVSDKFAKSSSILEKKIFDSIVKETPEFKYNAIIIRTLNNLICEDGFDFDKIGTMAKGVILGMYKFCHEYQIHCIDNVLHCFLEHYATDDYKDDIFKLMKDDTFDYDLSDIYAKLCKKRRIENS
jgi:hypothetical protein